MSDIPAGGAGRAGAPQPQDSSSPSSLVEELKREANLHNKAFAPSVLAEEVKTHQGLLDDEDDPALEPETPVRKHTTQYQICIGRVLSFDY
jgi:hypothetical protein